MEKKSLTIKKLNEIHSLIIQGRLNQAIQSLLNLLPNIDINPLDKEFISHSLGVLSANFHRLNKKNDASEFLEKELNRITNSIIEIISFIKTRINTSTQKQPFYKWLGVLLLVCLLFLLFVFNIYQINLSALSQSGIQLPVKDTAYIILNNGNGIINIPLIEKLAEKFDSAKYNIYITGSGLSSQRPNESERKIIDRYNRSIENAILRGVHIERIQFISTKQVDTNWINFIDKFLGKEKFHLWVIKDEPSYLNQICIVDNFFVENALSYFSSNSDGIRYAGSAIIVERKPELSAEYKAAFQDMKKRGAIEITRSADLHKFINDIQSSVKRR